MSEFDEHTTSPEDRVSWNQLIAYGMGGIVPIALFNIAGQLTQLLGNISLGLSAIWLGAILMFPRLWDAISDPLVGHISDNSRSRWGRRRPFILAGGLLVAMSFVAMWWIPRGDWIREHLGSEASYNVFQFVYILLGVVVFFTACTIFEIPHGALGMEMSSDYHERTRLFSAKSFFGNLFAMGTPWLLWFASLDFFRGPGGDLVDGMRYVSMFLALALVPMTFWWFFSLKEPGFQIAKQQEKTPFLASMQIALSNQTFLMLVAIVFVLAMGFNFVSIFSYYIAIFYLFGGHENPATALLGINGTLWAITGLVAVFPLNIISRRFGKSKTLLFSILMMCAAQLSKIVCYDPANPYLVLIPTVLLSAGMLMFFTLGSSMVGDVCDEDELHTGNRSEGTYYSVYWWFIKMGTAFASFVTGVLLTYTQFDEQQNKFSGEIYSGIGGVISYTESQLDLTTKPSEAEVLTKNLKQIQTNLDKLEGYLQTAQRSAAVAPEEAQAAVESLEHRAKLAADFRQIHDSLEELSEKTKAESASKELLSDWQAMQRHAGELRQQSPVTLFRLRAVEIGLPLLLSIASISLTLIYPLTEERSYEVKAELKKRRAEVAAARTGE